MVSSFHESSSGADFITRRLASRTRASALKHSVRSVRSRTYHSSASPRLERERAARRQPGSTDIRGDRPAVLRRHHQRDPSRRSAAELYYNDFNAWRPAKRDGIVRMVKMLQSEGIRIDGVGMQGTLGPELSTDRVHPYDCKWPFERRSLSLVAAHRVRRDPFSARRIVDSLLFAPQRFDRIDVARPARR
jgi:hypothetical protein